MMTTRTNRTAITGWRQLLSTLLVVVSSIAPVYAQGRTPSTGGGTHGPSGGTHGPTTGRPATNVYYPPTYSNPNAEPSMQPAPDVPPLPKPTAPNDEKCFPWNLSEVRSAAVSVTRLKIPGKARSEFEKACDASRKDNLEEAEKHARGAIDKYHNYSAAWVMLGVILEQQHKAKEAGEACAQAAAIETNYLPAYLCGAEFSVRSRDWKQVLDMANVAVGLNYASDGYAYYYLAAGYFGLNNLDEAKKNAVQAVEADASHTEASFSFLLAQIYEREGDKASAIAQLQQLLKHHSDRKQEDEVKQYLAKLESDQSPK
jgi:cytochrome c-type biogenesis protein CcmH/NrfG